jgi:hypothetical protein
MATKFNERPNEHQKVSHHRHSPSTSRIKNLITNLTGSKVSKPNLSPKADGKHGMQGQSTSTSPVWLRSGFQVPVSYHILGTSARTPIWLARPRPKYPVMLIRMYRFLSYSSHAKSNMWCLYGGYWEGHPCVDLAMDRILASVCFFPVTDMHTKGF